MQEKDLESQELAQEVLKEYSQARIQKEDHSVRAAHSAATVHADHSEKVQKDHAELSVKTANVQEETSQKDVHSAVTVHADHSARVQKDHAEPSVKTANVQEEILEKVQKEDHSETESHLAATEEAVDSEIPQRRA